MAIVNFALFTALCLGIFAAEIIWTAITYSKAAHYKNRIRVKNSSTWLASNWAASFYFAVQFCISIFYIHEFDFLDFTEIVFYILKAICSGLITLNIIFRMIFGTRAYITDNGIIAVKAFFPKGKAKYEVKKSEAGTYINLHTKNKGYDFSFKFNPKYEEDIINIMDWLGYEKYDENDNTAINLQKQSYFKRNLIILLCTAFVFVGGLLCWYSVTKPVIFVGDKIVNTDSEYALFSTAGYEDLLFSSSSKYYGELAEKADGMYDYVDHSENITSDDMAALQQMPNLKHLNVAANNIDDLTEIGKLTQLEGLAFGGGNMYVKPQDYSPIKNLTNLKYFSGLGLYNCNDLTIFENMDNLIYFELTAADIQNGFDVICEKENLACLNLFRCTAEDFSSIEKCVNLKKLVLSDTNVTNISFLKNLTELEYLTIENTNPEEYDKIGCCTKLKYLHISDTDITDLSFLKNLKELERLEIVGINNAEDYSVLLEMPSLKHIYMSPKDSVPHEIIEMLRENGIECDVRY